jgi:hypothetical protein
VHDQGLLQEAKEDMAGVGGQAAAARSRKKNTSLKGRGSYKATKRCYISFLRFSERCSTRCGQNRPIGANRSKCSCTHLKTCLKPVSVFQGPTDASIDIL